MKITWINESNCSRKWRRQQERSFLSRKYNSPLETPAAPSGPAPTPAAPVSTPPPPPAVTSPPPPPAVPSSAAGPGTSGLPTPGATPVSAAPGQVTGQPTPVAQPTFDQQFRQRYGMDPNQAQMLMHLGYQQYQGNQPRPGQPAPTPAPAQPDNIFGLPQFDYRLLDFVTKDPSTGSLVGLPGAPPDAVIRVQAFQDQLRKVQQGFFENPMQYLEKPIASLVEKRAQELYQQQFGQHQSATVARQIVAENDSWLYARDANNQKQFVFDPASGGNVPVLSPWGQYYQQCVQQLAQSGVNDPATANRLAVSMVENAAMKAKLQQTQTPPGNNPAAQQFLNTVIQPNQPAPAPAPVAQPASAPTIPMSIKDRMRQQFEANGINDQVLSQQLQRNGTA